MKFNDSYLRQFPGSAERKHYITEHYITIDERHAPDVYRKNGAAITEMIRIESYWIF
jgi:hypothetical protein